MKLTIEITMDNAAFDGDGNRHDEAARILRDAANKIEHGAWAFALLDINGNKVGQAEVEDKPLKPVVHLSNAGCGA